MTREPDRLAAAVRRLGAARPRRERPPLDASDVAARLARLEADVAEVRTRVNALFFAVITVAIGDFIGRLVVG